jgi:hypothetical protein
MGSTNNKGFENDSDVYYKKKKKIAYITTSTDHSFFIYVTLGLIFCVFE